MKFAKYISIVMVTLFLFNSCADELDIKPKEFLSPTNFEVENDIMLALTGTYKALTGMGVEGGDYQNIDPVITDFMTDNGFMDKSWMGAVEFWDQGQNENSALAKRKWTTNYMGILRANTILTYINQVTFSDDELRDRVEAEAMFLRAFFYSDLIMFFGDVPFRIEPEGLENQHKERTSQYEILEFIYKQLDSASISLPILYDEGDRGRVTKGAALTLKAWVALNYYDYSIAEVATKQVMDLGIYELYPKYSAVFSKFTEGVNNEVIFDAQYLEGKTNERLTNPWTTYFYAWSSYQADYSLAKEYHMKDGSLADETNPDFEPQNPFKNRDPRLAYTLTLPYSFDGFKNDGDTNIFIPYNKKAFNFTSLRIRKYVEYGEDYDLRGKKQSGTNLIFFRYADVLLMRAEALCELGGQANEPEIISLINQIRQRADVLMPRVQDSEGTGLSQEQLTSIIRHERRIELAYEGSRILDIKRWDIGPVAYSSGMGYDPNLLYYYIVNAANLEKMKTDGIVPSNMLRYLKNPNYFFDVIFKTEEAFTEKMAEVFNSDNGFNNGELDSYGDIIIQYVQPTYNIYTFRERSFDASKGYLWPIPFTEIQSNDLINTNNSGY